MIRWELNTVYQIIRDIGALSGFLTLFYTIAKNRHDRPKIKVSVGSSRQEIFIENGLEYCEFDFECTLRNQSTKANSITAIRIVVWGNNKRTRYKSFGHTPHVFESNGAPITLPLSFRGKGARTLKMKFKIPLTGTHDEDLAKAYEEIQIGGEKVQLLVNNYRLATVDVDENLFDDEGNIRDLRLLDLWWLLPNTFNKLKEGNIFPYIYHMSKIIFANIRFKVRKAFYLIGLWG